MSEQTGRLSCGRGQSVQPAPPSTPWLSWAALVALSLLAGWLCSRLTVPAAWMVGPMIIAIAFSAGGRWQLHMPRGVFAGAQAVVGVVIASMLRTSDLPVLLHHWYAVAMVGGGTLLISLVIGQVFARVTGTDRMTSVLGALPGGASGMVAMSASVNADAKLVAVMQYVRLILVVLSASLITRALSTSAAAHPALPPTAPGLPWYDTVLSLLIGAAGTHLGMRIRLPAGQLLGSILFATAANLSGLVHLSVPSPVAAAAYAVIGMYVGLLFDRPSLRHAGLLLPYMAATTAVLIGACYGLGWCLDRLTGDGLLTCVLATSPGGLDSVTLTAIGSGANIAFVVSLQTVRLFSIVLLGPILVRWLAQR